MAYLRGDYYIWTDGDDRVHLWAFDGADAWEDSGWARDLSGNRDESRKDASGVSIPRHVLDQFVVMRFAQLAEAGELTQVVDQAVRIGNFGGDALNRQADTIKRFKTAPSESDSRPM